MGGGEGRGGDLFSLIIIIPLFSCSHYMSPLEKTHWNGQCKFSSFSMRFEKGVTSHRLVL